ncbi:putative N-formylglutamate amidohydrolase [Roseiarcus fermentans]|uniref:Putative N-formylglutamate amidohydrolase n=1 Tax=Roseiarcus fermentans TaxID=1473586 RepID=A0A366F963_9HYPH|nr:N-formylglutamate amidohydrolase [Roseiarcus fermentans]RBP11167.1 putative N-formylglutamate amidohydrolase [Roseiarcus fermentans]
MKGANDALVHEPAVAVERPDAASPIVLLCDHASNRLPARHRALGLRESDFLEHIAWDRGALAVSRRLSALLDAPLVYGLVSRLALDVNRDPSDADSIVEVADGRIVPGNRDLSPAERGRRAAEIYAPYHAAVDDLLTKRKRAGLRSALVAVHTYTPNLGGVDRPWHCGVIFASDSRLGAPLAGALAAEDGLIVGVNQPYAPSDRVYHTLSRHGDDKGNPSVMIEVRNDLVSTEAGQADWAMRLAPLLQRIAQTVLGAGDRAAPTDDTTA